MGKSKTPTKVSEAIIAIILSSNEDLKKDQLREQERVFREVFKMIHSGKGQIEFNEKTGLIKPTAKNIAALNYIANKLNTVASPDKIKDAINNYNESAKRISEMNLAYIGREFESYSYKPVFGLPLEELQERVSNSILRDVYTDAFRNPIKRLISTYIQQGLSFQDLVKQLEIDITGINPDSEKTEQIQNGLLQNYHSLKRITRDTMFQSQVAETQAVAVELGENTVWYQYIGGLVEDSREVCIERVGKRYFTYKEIQSWKNIPKSEWKEKPPGDFDPFIIRGSYNCLHDIRMVSVSRVPLKRIEESYNEGFLTKEQYEKALAAKNK